MRAMKVFRLYVIADVAFRIAIVFVTQALPFMAIPPEGVAKDMKKAVHFFTIAAEAGHPKARSLAESVFQTRGLRLMSTSRIWQSAQALPLVDVRTSPRVILLDAPPDQ